MVARRPAESLVYLEQSLAPGMVPRPPLDRVLKGIAVRQLQQIMADLRKEAVRLNAAAAEAAAAAGQPAKGGAGGSGGGGSGGGVVCDSSTSGSAGGRGGKRQRWRRGAPADPARLQTHCRKL